MNNAISKYGWSAVSTESGFDLINKKGVKVVDVAINGKKYIFRDMRNNKLMDGNKNVIGAAVDLLTRWFFCQEVKS
jgi:hypothetical protein